MQLLLLLATAAAVTIIASCYYLLQREPSVVHHLQVMAIVGILQDETDPMVSVMKVSNEVVNCYDLSGNQITCTVLSNSMSVDKCGRLYEKVP